MSAMFWSKVPDLHWAETTRGKCPCRMCDVTLKIWQAYFIFLQSRMAVFSVQHAKPSMGRKQARSLLGRWNITSFLTAFPDTQTPRPFVLSMTFLPGSRSELCDLAKSSLMLLCSDPLFVLFKALLLLQLLRVSLEEGGWGVSHWGNSILLDHTGVLGRERLFRGRTLRSSKFRAINF